MKYDTAPVMTMLQPQGRLTLTTLVPVLIATVATSANVLYTPYQGNQIPIWDGAQFKPQIFAELTNVLANAATGSAGPAAAIAASNYDLFVWSNAGVMTLTRGPLWTSDTARGTGAGTTQLTMVNGVQTNTVAITNGPAAGYGTYVGTVRTDAGGATVSWSVGGAAAGGTPATINVWNMYNRVTVDCTVMDNTAGGWTYTTAVVRSANASVGNRVSFINGLLEDGIEASYVCRLTSAAALNAYGLISMCADTTNSLATGTTGFYFSPIIAGESGMMISHFIAGYIGWAGATRLGFHFLQATEQGDGTNANSFVGNNAGVQYGALRVTLRA